MLKLDSIGATRLDHPVKGLPLKALGRLAREIPQLNLGLYDLSFPCLVLKDSALEANIESLAAACRASGVELAPHGKTTMAPQIFARQLAAGAWGITLSTIQQVALAIQFGLKRVILANPLVNPGEIEWLAGLATQARVYLTLDSIAQTRALASGLRRAKSKEPVPVLIEYGIPGQRTGCRSLAEVKTLLDEILDHPEVIIPAGILGYEGLFETGRADEEERAIKAWLDELLAAADLLKPVRLFEDEVLISVGGSAFIDLILDWMAAQSGARMVLRSGCAVTHDHGWYDRFLARRLGSLRLKPALELWTIVQSRPEPDLVILSCGKRDAPYDIELPIPLKSARGHGESTRAQTELDRELYRLDKLYDQHARLRCPPASSLAVGDLVCLGISHPCGAFDRWTWLPLVDDDYLVTGLVKTFF